MTCYDALELLDDFVDGELNPTVAGTVKDHIENCAACREEFLATQRLKELLKQTPANIPSDDYWSQTEKIILARTVEADDGADTTSVTSIERRDRSEFVRSIISLAASIAILVSAVIVGQSQDTTTSQANLQSQRPVFLATAVVDQFPPGYPSLAGSDDELRLARGMMLMGAPGHLSRLAVLADMMTQTDRKK